MLSVTGSNMLVLPLRSKERYSAREGMRASNCHSVQVLPKYG